MKNLDNILQSVSNKLMTTTDAANEIQSIIDIEKMTLRDKFAGQAMQGWLAAHTDTPDHPVEAGRVRQQAHWAYKFADAMLAERKTAIIQNTEHANSTKQTGNVA